ncbi:MAG: SDR family NAD(P)-dependent oxidoreductase, partial [Candidatus Binatia bacterium]
MKHVIIFGAASAIAQAVARLWAERDHASFVLIDKNKQRLAIVADDLRVRGASDVHTVARNLTDLEKHAGLIETSWQHMSTSDMSERIVLIAYGTLGDQQRSEQDFTYTHNELTTNLISVLSLLTHLVNKLEAGQNPSASTLAVISSVAGDR